MIDALLSLALPSGITAAIGGALAALAALIGLYFKARHDGAKGERAKQDAARIEAVLDQDEIERAIAGNDAATNRKEAAKWVKR